MSKSINNNDLEEQINTTRIKLHEQTKNMTTQERVDYLNNKGKDILVRYGIKTIVTEMPIIRRQV